MKTFLLTLLLAGSIQAAALEVGDAAPCVVVNHIQADGTEAEHCIRDRLENQNYTILEFFSITCSACQANLPKLNMLGTSVAELATTRMVAIDRNEQAVREYIMKNQSELRFEIGLDVDRDAKKAYGVVSTPTLFVLDKDLVVVYKHEGLLSASDIMKIQDIVSK